MTARDGMDYPKTARQAELIDLAETLAGPIAARAEAVDRAGAFPYENFRELHEAGYLGMTIPRDLGGMGANVLEYALAHERIARACGSTALAANMHLTLIGKIAEVGMWPAETLGRVTRDIVENGALINSANSELEMGSPSRGGLPTTTAARTESGWVINGRKRWASMAPALTYLVTMATVVDGDAPRRGNFLVPANTPGVRVEKTWDNLGMRGTASDDVVFTNVALPFEAEAAPAVRATPRIRRAPAPPSRPSSAPRPPIAELQTIQHRIARIELDLLQARSLLYATAEEWLARPEERNANMWRLAAAKYAVTNAAMRATDEALKVAGSAGLAAASPLQRFFRDARTAIGQPPIEDVALTTVGKAALGLS
ncbi:MAG: acyl-CoA dehydrogenase domain protein [Thermomicrobiales bacterium]|nr:acyl-CoA dehydrogenase domain protein [Thermomicrobiales bacterium]